MGLINFILTCEKDNEELKKDINYYKNMASRLKKENQELKSQLEDANEKIILLQASEPMLNYKKALEETQQKEFIKYLEDESKEIYRDGGLRQYIFRQILRKYRSITGVSDENNIK